MIARQRAVFRARMTAYLSIESLCVAYGSTRVLDRREPRRRARRDGRAPRQLRLRQDDAAARDRRLRRARIGRDPRRRTRTSRALPPEKRGTAMMFQSYALWPHMTRRRQHRLRAAHARLEDATRSPRASRRCSKLLQLEGFGPRPVTQLSGGQRQRVALGRALAVEPVAAAARRADVEPRLQGAPRAAPRAPRAAAARRHHRGLRDARPRGGADARRPHRGDRRRPRRAVRRAARRSSTGPTSRVRRRVHGRGQRARRSSMRDDGALVAPAAAAGRAPGARAFPQRRGAACRRARRARRPATLSLPGVVAQVDLRRPGVPLSRPHGRRRGVGPRAGARRSEGTAAAVVVPREALVVFPASGP